MKFKKIILITLLLLAVLTISAVSASDNLTGANEEVLMDASSDEIELGGDDTLSSSQDEILKQRDNGTFTALQDKINGAGEGSTIVLENDYKYDDGFNKGGIVINKSLTIDGNYKTLDGDSKSRILFLNASNIVLKNIKFANAYSDNGGAIYINASNSRIVSCDFRECDVDGFGGAIYDVGGNSLVDSCDFMNCGASQFGGAICILDSENCRISSCVFEYCSSFAGGAIYNTGANYNISQCSFRHCSSKDNGGAIKCSAGNCTVSSCDFIDCANTEDAETNGGAIKISGANCRVVSCNFVKCSSVYGGAIQNDGVNFKVTSCNFAECSATERGGAIDNLGNNGNITSSLFMNCSANGMGGAIRVADYKCYIGSCSFLECYNSSRKSTENESVSGKKIISEDNEFTDSIPLSTVIEVSPLETLYNADASLVITLKEDGKYTLSNYTLSVNLNGVKTYKTDENGQVFISAKGLHVGAYNVAVIFAGNGDHRDSITETTIVVDKASTNLTADVVGRNIVVTLKDGNGNAVSGAVVSVDLNGVGNLTTDENGQAFISTDDLAPGAYDVKITFAGNENYNASDISTSVVVDKVSTSLTAGAVVTTYGVAKDLVITLKDGQGNALSGVAVSFNLNGVKSLTTDKNGQIKIAVGSLVPKTYTVPITFAGNDKYNASSTAVKVTVKKATPKITAKAKTFKKSVKTKKYKITLKNNKNKVMKNTKVTIKVKKKTYTAKTNKKGVATFKIKKLTKKGTYKSVITYKGDNYYNKVTKTVKIKVK